MLKAMKTPDTYCLELKIIWLNQSLWGEIKWNPALWQMSNCSVLWDVEVGWAALWFLNILLIPCLIKIYSAWTLSATVGQSSETRNQVRHSPSHDFMPLIGQLRHMKASYWLLSNGLCKFFPMSACMSEWRQLNWNLKNNGKSMPWILIHIKFGTSCCHYHYAVRKADVGKLINRTKWNKGPN